jgi:hypothetical protein
MLNALACEELGDVESQGAEASGDEEGGIAGEAGLGEGGGSRADKSGDMAFVCAPGELILFIGGCKLAEQGLIPGLPVLQIDQSAVKLWMLLQEHPAEAPHGGASGVDGVGWLDRHRVPGHPKEPPARMDEQGLHGA